MPTDDINCTRLNLTSFVMAFFTPIAGALMFTVAIIQLILLTSAEDGARSMEVYALFIPLTAGGLLAISGFLLLLGTLQKKTSLILTYLVVSSPSLVFVLFEIIDRNMWLYLKILLLIIIVLLFCGQSCVGYFLVKVVNFKRVEDVEEILFMYDRFDENGFSYFNDDISVDSFEATIV